MVAEFFLLDLERTVGFNVPYFWKGNKYGYTTHLEQAGIFPEDVARGIVANDKDNKTVMVNTRIVFKILGLEMKQREGQSYY